MSATAHSSDVLDLAGALTTVADLPMPSVATRLSGGRNNRAFRLETVSGPLVLKLYHADARDRLGAEFAFLTCAWRRGLRNIPQPLAFDRTRNAALYGFVPGHRLRPGDVSGWHVEAALDFVLAVNTPGDDTTLGPAAEACFSAAEHIATIERRLSRVDAIVATDDIGDTAVTFVAGRLRPMWAEVHARLAEDLKRAGIAFDAPTAVCLSPSDFGFHNALVDGEQISFLDFEYAGRDDPAKLVGDFFAQPELPAPPGLFAPFTTRLAEALHLDERDLARCRAFRSAYRVKWACILLNEFLPQGAARRSFAADAPVTEHRAAQLARAEAQMVAIETEGD